MLFEATNRNNPRMFHIIFKMSDEEANKSSPKRRKFRSKEEAAAKERKRKYNSSKIALGSSCDEFERQFAASGCKHRSDFIAHLLAVHNDSCISTCK